MVLARRPTWAVTARVQCRATTIYHSPFTIYCLKVARRGERRRGHRVAEADASASQAGDARLDLFGRERRLRLEEDPVDVLVVGARALNFGRAVFDEPEIEVDRHDGARVEAPAVLDLLHAVNKVFDMAAGDLRDERVPAGATAPD